MMVAPIGLSGGKEFRKNSINIDKFTGFFDKFPKIFEGKCVKLRGIAGSECGQMRVRKPFPAAGFRRRIRAQGNSAMVRGTVDDGKCGELRG